MVGPAWHEERFLISRKTSPKELLEFDENIFDRDVQLIRPGMFFLNEGRNDF